MVHYAREFIRDSTSSQRRAAAVQAGRKLLHVSLKIYDCQ